MIVHQLVGLLRREHGGGLVEDEHLGVAGERLDDLDALLHADGQVLDERVGVDVEAEARRRSRATRLRAASRSRRAAEAGRLVAEHHVLGDGEDGDQHEVLVHHADAGAHRVAGAGEVLDVVVEQDLALVGAGTGRRARSSAWTCPRRSRRAGSGSRRARPSRSMWSLATRVPNRLVMPRSSSFMVAAS